MTIDKTNKIACLLAMSSTFEYYDFVIYGLMSSYLGQLFFPNEDLFIGQLQAFSLFALGYVVRPFGGVILAYFGDFKSQKKIYVRSNFILALATIAISLLPNYNQMGVTASVVLIILRILQSITFAVELPGAMTFLQSNKNPEGFSFVISGSALGAILASATLYILESNFSREEILNYAWRIPFILGSLLCIVSIYLKSYLPENSSNKFKNKIEVLISMLPKYRYIIASVLMISLPAFLVVMNIFFSSFIPKFYGYTVKEVYLAIIISLIYSIFYTPVFAYSTKNIDKLSLIKGIIAAAIFLGLVINFLFLRHSFIHLIIGLCIYQSINCGAIVTIFPLMASKFAENNRFTLMTACYNISYSLMAFSPILVTKLAEKLNSPFAMWAILIGLCIFILANLAKFEEDPAIN